MILFLSALISSAIAGAMTVIAALALVALWAVSTGRVSVQMSEQTRASLVKLVPGGRRRRSAP